MRNSGSSAVHTGYNTNICSGQDRAGEQYRDTLANNNKGELIPFNYETVPDEVLVELYKTKRDQTALSKIIERYRDTIFGFAIKLTNNRSDAEDIFQDISLTLVKKLHTFKGNSKFSTWLYRITLNASYMILNKRKRTKNHEVNTEHIYDNASQGEGSSGRLAQNPLATALYKENSGLVLSAVNELSSRNKEIITLKDMYGFSNAEVARKLGITVPAVKSSLLRSRHHLRKKLRAYFGGLIGV